MKIEHLLFSLIFLGIIYLLLEIFVDTFKDFVERIKREELDKHSVRGYKRLKKKAKRENRKDFEKNKCLHLWYNYETMSPILESKEYLHVESMVRKDVHPLSSFGDWMTEEYSTHCYCPKCKTAGKRFGWIELYQYALLLEEKGYPVTPKMLEKQIEIKKMLETKYKKRKKQR